VRNRGKFVKVKSITFEKEFMKFHNVFVLLPCGDGVAELQNVFVLLPCGDGVAELQNVFVLLPFGDGVAELQNSVFKFHVQLKQSAATGMYLSEESHVVILMYLSEESHVVIF